MRLHQLPTSHSKTRGQTIIKALGSRQPDNVVFDAENQDRSEEIMPKIILCSYNLSNHSSFLDHQDSSLYNYIETSLMLQFCC